MTLPAQSSMFKSAEGEAQYMAACDAALALWPTPFDTLEVGGRFGCTHIHAAGPKDAPPERVRRIVVMDPAGSLLPLVSQFYIRAMLGLFFPGNAMIYNFVRWMTSRRLPAGQARMSEQPVVRQFVTGFKVWKQESGVNPNVFSDDELRGVTAPALLMMGEDEVIYSPVRAIERARQLIPDLQAEVIPDAGHAISMEQPEIVNQHIVKFLA